MSLHIEAKQGDIAETVLLPGDPLRARWIAETYLEDAYCYNHIRGMFGYTGHYQGKQVSVQGSGMGIPSALIYINELIESYGVKRIIRTGTAGALQPELELRDLVLALSASTLSGINRADFPIGDFAPAADLDLLLQAVDFARNRKLPFRAGNVLSADAFYPSRPDAYDTWKAYGVLCVEMETAGLYALAARHSIQALSVLTISDSLINGLYTSAREREQDLRQMAELALALS
jgi:purine-nucleoside phosphorylase